MKTSLSLLFGLLFFNIFAAENEPSVKNKKLKIGINISPDIAFRQISLNDNQYGIYLKEEKDRIDRPKASYSVGLNVCYDFKSWLGAEIGVQYASRGYNRSIQELVYEDMTIVKVRGSEDFHYVDIPMKVNFTLGKSKVRFFSSVGIAPNFLIKYEIKSTLFDEDKTYKTRHNYTSKMNRINVSPLVSVGIDWKVNSKMNLRVEPTFRYGLINTFNGTYNEHLYSAGINVSYYFGVK